MDYNSSPPSYTKISIGDPGRKADETPLRPAIPSPATYDPQYPRSDASQFPVISPQIVYVSHVYQKYRSSRSIALGAVQIIIGGLCILAIGFVRFNETRGISSAVTQALSGFGLFIITGSIGIAAGKTRSQSLVTAFLIMNIFSVLVAIGLLATSALAVHTSNTADYDCGYNEYAARYRSCSGSRVMYWTYVVLLCVSLLGVLMSICGSCLGCGVACKKYVERETIIDARGGMFQQI